MRWLGITISPSYVGEPECNGVIERFNRTLKEQCVYLHRFESLEQARAIIGTFIERYCIPRNRARDSAHECPENRVRYTLD